MSVATHEHRTVADAAAGGGFLSRVKRLRQGEHARLPDGGGVARQSTRDGRDVFRPFEPTSYGDSGISMMGREHRNPERAVRQALRHSAERTDPASLGGEKPYARWRSMTMGGKPVRLHHVDTHGRPHVTPESAMRSAVPTPTAWDALDVPIDPERLMESAKTAALSVTPKPFSKSKTSNWVARAGGLPSYIQQVAHGIQRSGKSESQAIQMAIGKIKDWASGRGGVSAEVKAASAKALAAWEKLKAKSHAKSAVKEAAELTDDERRVLAEYAGEHLVALTLAAGSETIGELLSEAEDAPWPSDLQEAAIVYGAIVEAFDESAHPRGEHGKWTGKIGALKHGASVKLPGGTSVARVKGQKGKDYYAGGDHFAVRGKGGDGKSVYVKAASPSAAAHHALATDKRKGFAPDTSDPTKLGDGRIAHRDLTHHTSQADANKALKSARRDKRYPPGAKFSVEQRSPNRWTVKMDARGLLGKSVGRAAPGADVYGTGVGQAVVDPRSGIRGKVKSIDAGGKTVNIEWHPLASGADELPRKLHVGDLKTELRNRKLLGQAVRESDNAVTLPSTRVGETVMEAFDELAHPRGEAGKWIAKSKTFVPGTDPTATRKHLEASLYGLAQAEEHKVTVGRYQMTSAAGRGRYRDAHGDVGFPSIAAGKALDRAAEMDRTAAPREAPNRPAAPAARANEMTHVLPDGTVERRRTRRAYTHVVTVVPTANAGNANLTPGKRTVLSWHGSAKAADAKRAEVGRRSGSHFRDVKAERIKPHRR